MIIHGHLQLPEIGSEILTACGTPEKFQANTPRAMHEGKWIFFCLPICQEEFIQDPKNSCLTSHEKSENG